MQNDELMSTFEKSLYYRCGSLYMIPPNPSKNKQLRRSKLHTHVHLYIYIYTVTVLEYLVVVHNIDGLLYDGTAAEEERRRHERRREQERRRIAAEQSRHGPSPLGRSQSY